MSRGQARQNLSLATLAAVLTFSFAPEAWAGLRYGEHRPPVLDEVANLRVGVDPDGVLPFVAETREFIVTMSDPNKNDLVTFSLRNLIGPDGLEHPLADLGLL
ncbi:MAG TPA: hypothetical protein VFP10_04635, partial [Candidatus Eisenbacteria bacterium]|nr:hypothetical protein [Candidatus Eisenbacteria bacterium]